MVWQDFHVEGYDDEFIVVAYERGKNHGNKECDIH